MTSTNDFAEAARRSTMEIGAIELNKASIHSFIIRSAPGLVIKGTYRIFYHVAEQQPNNLSQLFIYSFLNAVNQ